VVVVPPPPPEVFFLMSMPDGEIMNQRPPFRVRPSPLVDPAPLSALYV
jgi:hypothetical protein